MSGEQVQESGSAAPLQAWLEENTRLPAASRRLLATVVSALVFRIEGDRECRIGISGAPGSGKSTLSRALVYCLNQTGIPAFMLSLDNYYLGRAERARLATDSHPLFDQRGVPGTHDLNRLLSDLDKLSSGDVKELRLPVFDKSADDRAPVAQSRVPAQKPRVLIVEGWCIGAAAPEQYQEAQPINELERLRDADARWRSRVLREWKLMHRELARRLNQVWYIHVPDWECVVDWRWQQEQELAQKKLKSRAEVEDFLGRFERIVRQMQASYPDWTDIVIEADRQHGLHLPPRYRTDYRT